MNDTPTPRTQVGIDDWINTGEISVLGDISEELETELTAARKELKKHKEANGHLQKDIIRFATHIDAVTKQRDRLAEALRKIDSNLHGRNDGFECRKIAAEALQSLTLMWTRRYQRPDTPNP